MLKKKSSTDQTEKSNVSMTVDTSMGRDADLILNQTLMYNISHVVVKEEEVELEAVISFPDNNFLPFAGESPKGYIFPEYFAFACFGPSSGLHFS